MGGAPHPQLLAPVLQIVHRIVATVLIKQGSGNANKRPAAADRDGHKVPMR